MAENTKRRTKQINRATTATPAEPLDELIRRRAYDLYLERGDRPGSSLEDWLQAERDACGR